MVGKGVTVTKTVSVLIHPLESVPVTVYVCVDAGAALTGDPEIGDNPVVGSHV